MSRWCGMGQPGVDEGGGFFFNDTATTEIYTLSLHDALPIWRSAPAHRAPLAREGLARRPDRGARRRRLDPQRDRKSTRLNSSHANISYAVFCLKKNHSVSFTTPRTIVSTPSTPVRSYLFHAV